MKKIFITILMAANLFALGCIQNDNLEQEIISECKSNTNNYNCNSISECQNTNTYGNGEIDYSLFDTTKKRHDAFFPNVGETDYCLFDLAPIANYPAKVCQAIEKEFMKEYCLQSVQNSIS